MKLKNCLIPIAVLLSAGNTKFQANDHGIEYSKLVSQENCYHNGHRLYGRIQMVESFADLKVQVVTSFPDLKVKLVENHPSRCGEWQLVNHFPDLKVQVVSSFPDIKIQFVESFPGMKK